MLKTFGMFATLILLSTTAFAGSKTWEALKQRDQASEARSNLKLAYTAEKAYASEEHKYSPSMAVLGFDTMPRNRYSYYFAPSGPIRRSGQGKTPDQVIWGVDQIAYPHEKLYPTAAETHCPVTPEPDGKPVQVGVFGDDSHQAFLILAAGNLDGDPELDCWTIASFDRKSKSGAVIRAGEPYHEQSDYDEALAKSYEQLNSDLSTFNYAVGQMPDDDGSRRIYSFETLQKAVPHIKLTRQDPWGSNYVVLHADWEEWSESDHIIIISAGPDRVLETDDDIVTAIAHQ